MHSEAPSSGTLPPGGLPPVKPPSGKFIAQLFLVPLLIVLGIMGLFFTLRGLFGIGGPHTAEQFLHSLDQANPDVRWRAAQDLAQFLPRDDKLAADPKFALDLADRLRQTLRDCEAEEKTLAELSRSSTGQSDEDTNAISRTKKNLEASRMYANFLAASLGGFSLPVGVPLLKEMALTETGQEAKVLALYRRQAVWALANLGMSLKRFEKLPPAEQDAALETLQREAIGSGERGKWAKAALERTMDRLAGKPHGLGEDYLGLADADDPYLRELFALSLNFWDADPLESERIDATLNHLSRDTGKGEELLAQLTEESDATTQAFTKYPGLRVRYNATTALARRGSKLVSLSLLKEMLDEPTQLEYCRRKQSDGKEIADEATAIQTVLETLKTVAELHRKRPELDLSELRPLVDKLAESDNVALRTEAKNTQIILD